MNVLLKITKGASNKILYIVLAIGLYIFGYSWVESYPVSFESPHLFIFNNFSPFYWISIVLISGSIYLIVINTNNNNIKWILSSLTFLLIYSNAYFHYVVPGSDTNSFMGLTDNLLINGDISITKVQSYYQWPLFFIINALTTNVINVNLNTSTHIIFFIMSLTISTAIYLYSRNHGEEGYFSVISFTIILYYFINYQWVPYTISLIPLFLIIYLDYNVESFSGVIMNTLIFLSLCYYHLITPFLVILYYFFIFVLTRNRKYINLFLLTFITYIVIQSYGFNFGTYIQKVTEIYLFEFQRTVGQIQVTSATERPSIDFLAQIISRSIIPITAVLTTLGFFFVYRAKKLNFRDYALLLSGMIFGPTLFFSFQSYPSIFWRTIPIAFLPISLGASALLKKYSKAMKPLFLVIVLLFSFVLIHNSMYDREVFVTTENDYKEANFFIDNVNLARRNKVLSHFRVLTYLREREGDILELYYDDAYSINDTYYYYYITYSIGLGKNYIQHGYTIEESFALLEQNNIVFSSGKYNTIYHND